MSHFVKIAIVAVALMTAAAVAQSGTPECSGSNLHLSLATAGSQVLSAGKASGYGVVMFGLSNPATCVTQGVAYITSAQVDSSTSYLYGWALVCISVPGCTAGTEVARTVAVTGSIFSPSANHSTFLSWTSQATIGPGIYGLALGTTCPSTATCTTLWGDVANGSWYPFVQAGTGTTGSYQWTFGSGGFTFNSQLPPTNLPPVLGASTGIAPPAAILY